MFFSTPDLDSFVIITFTKIVLEYASECIPNKFVTIHSRDKPDMTSAARKLFRLAKRMNERAKITQNPVHNYRTFSGCPSSSQISFSTARSESYKNISDIILNPNTNCKTYMYWKLSKLVYGNKIVKGIPDMLNNDSLVSDAAGKADLFNRFSVTNVNYPQVPMLISCQVSTRSQSLTSVILPPHQQKCIGLPY